MIEIYSGNKIKVRINNQPSEEHTIIHRVRQGCPLSPTLYNIYMNEIIVKRNQTYTKGITLPTTTKINNLLFADDQVTKLIQRIITEGNIYITKQQKILE